MARFKCNDCNKKFTGDEFTENCPSCGSENIEKEERKIIILFRRFWVHLLALLALLLIVFLLLTKDNQKSYIYELGFSQINEKKDHIDINIRKIEIDPKDSTQISRPKLVNENKKKDLIIAYNIKAEDKNGDEINITKGNIYPYNSGDTLSVFISWQNSMKYPLKNAKDGEKFSQRIYYTGIINQDYATCYPHLKGTDIIIERDEKCHIIVKITKLDTTSYKDDVKVSVTGMDGPFKIKRKWKAKDINKNQVVCVFKDDTVKSVKFNDDINPIGCNNCDNPDSIKNVVISIANNFGETLNRQNRIKLKKEINIEYCVFYIDNERIGKFSSFSNEIESRPKENGTKYTVADIYIDPQTGVVKKIKFISIPSI